MDLVRRNILAFAAVSIPLISVARAHDFRAGDLRIDHPWTRAVPPRAPTAAGYLVVRNTGAVADRLVAVETLAAHAGEIHEMTTIDNVARMRPVEGGIVIPAGSEVRLVPNGLHLMLVGPNAEAFVRGARVPLTLVFERAGHVEVELAVETMGARAGEHGGH